MGVFVEEQPVPGSNPLSVNSEQLFIRIQNYNVDAVVTLTSTASTFVVPNKQPYGDTSFFYAEESTFKQSAKTTTNCSTQNMQVAIVDKDGRLFTEVPEHTFILEVHYEA